MVGLFQFPHAYNDLSLLLNNVFLHGRIREETRFVSKTYMSTFYF